MSGLKLKLKTSPTKVRLVSLKKSWKQAGRSHERRDVDFAESAEFAVFDLCNLPCSISATEHSSMVIQTHSKGDFPGLLHAKFQWCQTKRNAKKRGQKSKKIVITSRRAGKVWKVPNSSASLVSVARPKFPSVIFWRTSLCPRLGKWWKSVFGQSLGPKVWKKWNFFQKLGLALGLGLWLAFEFVKMSTFDEPDGVQGWESDEKSVFGQSFGSKVWKKWTFIKS